MSREFHPCAFCCALTNGVDADGDPACRPGHGCTVKRKQPRASKPWTRWSNNDVEIVRRGYACGTPVAPIARLQDLFDEARTQLQSFAAVSLQWIPRHRNTEADALARAALGCAPKPPARAFGKRRKK